MLRMHFGLDCSVWKLHFVAPPDETHQGPNMYVLFFRPPRAVLGLLCTPPQLLDKLPHTVRGMGMTLLRPLVPQCRLPRAQQERRDILANLAGFIVVVRACMLHKGFFSCQAIVSLHQATKGFVISNAEKKKKEKTDVVSICVRRCLRVFVRSSGAELVITKRSRAHLRCCSGMDS